MVGIKFNNYVKYSYYYFVTNLGNLIVLPITSEKMDGFLCSMCLIDRTNMPNMIVLVVSGATISWVIKNEILKNFYNLLTFKILNTYKYSFLLQVILISGGKAYQLRSQDNSVKVKRITELDSNVSV